MYGGKTSTQLKKSNRWFKMEDQEVVYSSKKVLKLTSFVFTYH